MAGERAVGEPEASGELRMENLKVTRLEGGERGFDDVQRNSEELPRGIRSGEE